MTDQPASAREAAEQLNASDIVSGLEVWYGDLPEILAWMADRHRTFSEEEVAAVLTVAAERLGYVK